MSCKNKWALLSQQGEEQAFVPAPGVDGGARCMREGCEELVNLTTQQCLQGHVQGDRGSGELAVELADALLCALDEVEDRTRGGDPRAALARYLVYKARKGHADDCWIIETPGEWQLLMGIPEAEVRYGAAAQAWGDGYNVIPLESYVLEQQREALILMDDEAELVLETLLAVLKEQDQEEDPRVQAASAYMRSLAGVQKMPSPEGLREELGTTFVAFREAVEREMVLLKQAGLPVSVEVQRALGQAKKVQEGDDSLPQVAKDLSRAVVHWQVELEAALDIETLEMFEFSVPLAHAWRTQIDTRDQYRLPPQAFAERLLIRLMAHQVRERFRAEGVPFEQWPERFGDLVAQAAIATMDAVRDPQDSQPLTRTLETTSRDMKSFLSGLFSRDYAPQAAWYDLFQYLPEEVKPFVAMATVPTQLGETLAAAGLRCRVQLADDEQGRPALYFGEPGEPPVASIHPTTKTVPSIAGDVEAPAYEVHWNPALGQEDSEWGTIRDAVSQPALTLAEMRVDATLASNEVATVGLPASRTVGGTVYLAEVQQYARDALEAVGLSVDVGIDCEPDESFGLLIGGTWQVAIQLSGDVGNPAWEVTHPLVERYHRGEPEDVDIVEVGEYHDIGEAIKAATMCIVEEKIRQRVE